MLKFLFNQLLMELACPEAHGDHLNQVMQAREPVASLTNLIVIQNYPFF